MLPVRLLRLLAAERMERDHRAQDLAAVREGRDETRARARLYPDPRLVEAAPRDCPVDTPSVRPPSSAA